MGEISSLQGVLSSIAKRAISEGGARDLQMCINSEVKSNIDLMLQHEDVGKSWVENMICHKERVQMKEAFQIAREKNSEKDLLFVCCALMSYKEAVQILGPGFERQIDYSTLTWKEVNSGKSFQLKKEVHNMALVVSNSTESPVNVLVSKMEILEAEAQEFLSKLFSAKLVANEYTFLQGKKSSGTISNQSIHSFRENMALNIESIKSILI